MSEGWPNDPDIRKAADLLSAYAEPRTPCEHCLVMDDDRVWDATHELRLLQTREPPTTEPRSATFLCDYHTKKLCDAQGKHWVVIPLLGLRIGEV